MRPCVTVSPHETAQRTQRDNRLGAGSRRAATFACPGDVNLHKRPNCDSRLC